MIKINRDESGVALLNTFWERFNFSIMCFLMIVGTTFIWTIGIPINFGYWIITGKSLSKILINLGD